MNSIVVGAGLAGLAAAADLDAAGVQVTVLEARERVGGRMHGIEVAPGNWVDAGAAYLGERHTELNTMLAELGLKTVATGMVGDSRFDLGSGVGTEPGRFPPLHAVALGELFDHLTDLTASVRVDAPWRTPGAVELDTTTAADWAARTLRHPDAKLFFPLFLGEMMAADPVDVSVLRMAFYLRSGGGLRYLNAFEGGAQQDRVDGGAHQVCERLAAGLDVRLHEPVHAISSDPSGVEVRTAAGIYRADSVVVAVPPLLADQIDIQPTCPPRSSGRTAKGCAVKVHLVYPTPVWRDHGLSGWSVNSRGPLLSTVDDSPPTGEVGVLTGFVTGSHARQYALMPLAEQRATATSQAAQLFGCLPEPIDFHVADWVNEEYSQGCYAALLGPGDWERLGPRLRRPNGRVHWAGTETSTEFFGLMEGAIRSGRRAAAEILTTR